MKPETEFLCHKSITPRIVGNYSKLEDVRNGSKVSEWAWTLVSRTRREQIFVIVNHQFIATYSGSLPAHTFWLFPWTSYLAILRPQLPHRFGNNYKFPISHSGFFFHFFILFLCLIQKLFSLWMSTKLSLVWKLQWKKFTHSVGERWFPYGEDSEAGANKVPKTYNVICGLVFVYQSNP